MFYFDSFYGKKVLKSTLLDGVEHFFTTREFPLTSAAREDLKDICEDNRKFLCEKFNIPSSGLLTANQIHSANILHYDGEHSFYDNCDAVISSKKNTAILLNFADCTPVILYDKVNNVAAVVHAGWRGTAQNIAAKTVDAICSYYGSKPEDIVAVIGPAISKCCFETSEDVFEKLVPSHDDKYFYYDSSLNKYFVDLKLLNEKQLLDKGLKNIDICDYCTVCMSDIFFSYRKEKGITARHSAVIKL
ncbi:MAG: peptidoglycan editing factor PgeF [Candidatus Gastranaerophilales bacterium]|nr:peptidoglycan editing factor PgeF [Candidatus Gastranaerophilales bacterium]